MPASGPARIQKTEANEAQSSLAGLELRQAQEELRASHEQLRFVLSSIADTYFAVSRDWRLLDINPAAERSIFQHPKEALLGQNIWSACPQDKNSEFYRQYEKAFREGQPVHFESQGCIGDLWFEIHAYPAGDRLDVYGRDITERKRIEERLRMTQFTVDQASEAIFWIDSKARVIYANDAACEALGYEREELLTRTVHDLDPLVQPEAWSKHWEQLRQCGRLTFESRHRRKSGETFPVEITTNHVLYSGCEYHCAFVHNITERKGAEQNLRQQIDRLKLLNESAAYLLSADNPATLVENLYHRIADSFETDAVIEYECEGAGLRLKTCIGLDRATQDAIARLELGQALCGTVAQDKVPLLVNHLEASPNPKAQLLKELGFRCYICHPLILGQKFIGTLAFASRRRAVFGEADQEFFQTISHYVALGKDRACLLTQLRRHAEDLGKTVAERTSKLQEMVGELEHFSYAITHDMRAPLRAMAGFSRLLVQQYKTALDQRATDYLQRIHTAAQRMDNLITDALQYSQAVRQEPRLVPVNALALLRGMVQSYPHLAAPQVVIDIVEPIPPVLANPAGLTQCFSNLLSNAVKFVKPGQTPRVRIWAQEVREQKSEVTSQKSEVIASSPSVETHKPQPSTLNTQLIRIWFDDNGIGIPREYQNQIFGMFQRLSEGYEGTGIGLALVRKVAERMGGRVGVESEEDQGSRFWLELRRA